MSSDLTSFGPHAHNNSSFSDKDKEASSSFMPSVEDSFPMNLSPGDFNTITVKSWYLKSVWNLHGKCKDLEDKINKVTFLKNQTLFSPLEKCEKLQFTLPMDEENLSEQEWNSFKLRMYFHKNEMLSSLKPNIHLLIQEKTSDSAERKQVFILTYLQDLHQQLFVIPRLSVLRMTFIKESMFDETKFCCLMIHPLSYQQGLKHLFCNRNRNCTISQVYLDLQCYQHITLQYNQEILVLTPKLLLDYSLVYQIVCYNQCQTMRIGRQLAFGLH